MGGKNVNILVVDDHVYFCDQMTEALDLPNIRVLCAYSEQEALEISKGQVLQAAAIDARLPPGSGIRLIKRLRSQQPHIKILGITSFGEEPTLLDFAYAGVQGILLKRDFRKPLFRETIQKILDGGTYFDDEVRALLDKHAFDAHKSGPAEFSPKELGILKFLSKGLSSKEIADCVQLESTSVETYRKRMMRQTDTKTSAELVAYAFRNGLL
jgi:DNA-binding NarL/FixJ family response regulator